ncbi:MAG: recombinase family protein [Clostridium sp.]|nr:recombinase family protein [Clostridium sp.]
MKIAIYTRKSVAIENSESIETQVQLCKSYFNGNNEFEIFEDEGFSGGNTNRPAFKRMMNLARLGIFDIVAVYKVDRIARNIVDFFKIYDELEKLNIKLISITEGFDPSTPAGKMMMIMLAGFADMERESIRQRVKDNMISLAKKGCFTGGFIPFGCEVEKIDGKSYLKIVDIDLLNLIFNKYLETESLYSTQKYLLENNIKTLANRNSLGKLLRNPIYCESNNEVSTYLSSKGFEIVGTPNGKGYMTYGKTADYPTAIVGKHKAAISSNLFLKVNKVLDKNKDDFTKRKSKTYWLSEVLYCPHCNSKYALCNSGRNTYYVCSNRLNRASNSQGIDKIKNKCINSKYVNANFIEKSISSLMNEIDDIDFIKKAMSKNNVNFDLEISILEKQLRSNKNSIDNLIEKLMLLSDLAAKPVTNKIEELTLKTEDIKRKIENLKLKQLENSISTTPEEILNNIRYFNTLTDNTQKRIVLKRIFKKINYDPFTDITEIII